MSIGLFKKKLIFFVWVGLCMGMIGCRTTLYDRFYIEEDQNRAKTGQTNIEDSVDGDMPSSGASIFPQGTTYKYKGKRVIKEGKVDQIILHNPYEIYISIRGPKHPTRGRMSEIEIQECYFELFFLNGETSTLNMSTNRKDWVKQEYESPKGRKVISFASGLRDNKDSFTGAVDIDYVSLKEVHFYIKYVGVYENGERREYWKERYYVPKFVTERRNWFDWLAVQ